MFKKKLLRGRSIHGMVAACLYFVCKFEKVPITLQDILNETSVDSKVVKKCYKVLIRKLNLKSPQINPISFIPKYCADLGLSIDVEIDTINLMKFILNNTSTYGIDKESFSDYLIFKKGGFNKIKHYDDAKNYGITSQGEYDDFKNSGFNDYEEYKQAKSVGFVNVEHFYEAEYLRVPNYEKFMKFKNSEFYEKYNYDNRENYNRYLNAHEVNISKVESYENSFNIHLENDTKHQEFLDSEGDIKPEEFYKALKKIEDKPGENQEKRDKISQNAITTLLTLKEKNQFTKSGIKRKATIYKTIRTLGFGIENELERIYELIFSKRVIFRITNQSVKFSSDFITKQNSISRDEFRIYCQTLILN